MSQPSCQPCALLRLRVWQDGAKSRGEVAHREYCVRLPPLGGGSKTLSSVGLLVCARCNGEPGPCPPVQVEPKRKRDMSLPRGIEPRSPALVINDDKRKF